MKISERLLPWQVLLSLSEGKGFSLAADKFGRDEAFYCRLTHGLETEIGIRLTEPHSRPVRLTQDAIELLPEIECYLEAAKKLKEKISASGSHKLSIKFGIPVNVPRTSFVEIIQSYSHQDPNLKVEILSDVDHEDVISGKVDIAYLPYRPPAEGLFIWDVNKVGNVPLATPEYVRRRGNPQSPEDLRTHDIILRAGRNYPATTHLQKDGELRHLSTNKLFSPATCYQVKSADGRMGVAIDLSLAFCWRDIEQGRLLPVLNGWSRAPWDLTVAIKKQNLSNQRLVALARALVEHETKASIKRAEFYALGLQKLKARQ